ncbi:alpha/beta hydrolase [Sphingorhabdus sp. EL138]|uniref:alpha/beta hydrolase n=1 Tax=Sphingorhabdus sp. EL138 TaxID=2073156 RepID=UPI0013A54F27|nr:alpha/beta hydrolase [Sphingorhabdus sp. EL138]
MKRIYADSRHGQIHVRYWQAGNLQAGTPTICLQPIPYSGLYFEKIAPLLNTHRDVVAPDYPGYGGSDPLPDKPTIRQYAEAMLDTLDEMGFEDPVDLMGFHTGCLVAPEIANIAGDRVRSMVLVDVPYFGIASQKTLYDQAVSPHVITEELISLEKFWRFSVSDRKAPISLDRAYSLFLEQARSGNGEYLGYHAAFTYPAEDIFSAIPHSILLIATQSGLLDATRQAAKVFPNCRLTECLEIKALVMDTGADKIAKLVTEYLSV